MVCTDSESGWSPAATHLLSWDPLVPSVKWGWMTHPSYMVMWGAIGSPTAFRKVAHTQLSTQSLPNAGPPLSSVTSLCFRLPNSLSLPTHWGSQAFLHSPPSACLSLFFSCQSSHPSRLGLPVSYQPCHLHYTALQVSPQPPDFLLVTYAQGRQSLNTQLLSCLFTFLIRL